MENVKIIEYHPFHIEEIMEKNPRIQEIELFRYQDWGKLIWKWYETGPAYTLIIGNDKILCAGITIIREGFGEAWMIISSLFYNHKKTSFKVVKEKLNELISVYDLYRVQALSITDFSESSHWLKHLGFENETPTEKGIRKIAPNKKDMYLYARVK